MILSIDCANLNSPKQTVLSGPSADIARVTAIKLKVASKLTIMLTLHPGYPLKVAWMQRIVEVIMQDDMTPIDGNLRTF